MDQALALEIMLSGENVLLTGPAGSGKTYVLGEFIKLARKSSKKVAVTATTGLAASHLGGTTIHAWSGLGIHDSLPPRFAENLTQSRRDIITATDVLIIDEVSMLHDFRLDLVDQAVQAVRGNDRPFGGIQVILCGDFFQLPPVNRAGSVQGGFIFGSASWISLAPVICYLQEQHRQNDETFLGILNAMRAGDVRRGHAEALLARLDAHLSGPVTELHTTNADVDWINQVQLDGMEGESKTYVMMTTGKANYVDSLRRSCLALDELTVKLGALVMCVKNHPQGKYMNGSLGTVVAWEDLTGYPVVRLRSGKQLTIIPETWELRDGDKKRASLTQVPLRLAWAITVHKSQGMTLDAARIDLRRAFTYGMGYVALSRVRSLDTLSLVGINQLALKVSPEALAIDGALREQVARDALRFAPLAELANSRADEVDKPETKAGHWTERIQTMRQTYPNAFRPWPAEADELLKARFEAGDGLATLASLLGRQPGGVRARIKKHFGDEVEIPD
ncbi:AAA family ATPase [Candidatus Saccharibacteria bacterium]|nr:AAA family ATPase [Candidatus Saccharibacteria bacterium]